MSLFTRAFGAVRGANEIMKWNGEQIPYGVALQIGWNLPMDVVGAGVYGGIVKRKPCGSIIVGHEWPEDNFAPPAHNPVHKTGPYLDYDQLTQNNRGYTQIARLIQDGNLEGLKSLLECQEEEHRVKLANLVMTGGARPLHMCGMGRGGDTSRIIEILINAGAEVNAKDNYELTPMDRLASNSVRGRQILMKHGGKYGSQLARGVPDWTADEFSYTGPGEK